jgi:hypothetical protein
MGFVLYFCGLAAMSADYLDASRPFCRLRANPALGCQRQVEMIAFIAWQIEQEMKVQNLNKTTMAKKMHTSRASLNRLLDENNTSLTLTTLASAAAVLGKKLKVELLAA